jgi:hypothetical protein
MRVCLGGGYKQKRMKSVKNVMPEVSIHPRLNSLRLPPDSRCLRIYLQDASPVRATGSRIEGPNNMHGYEPLLQVIIVVPMFPDVVLLDTAVAVLALDGVALALDGVVLALDGVVLALDGVALAPDAVLLDTAVAAPLDIAVAVLALDTAVAALVPDVVLLDAHLVAAPPP